MGRALLLRCEAQFPIRDVLGCGPRPEDKAHETPPVHHPARWRGGVAVGGAGAAASHAGDWLGQQRKGSGKREGYFRQGLEESAIAKIEMLRSSIAVPNCGLVDCRHWPLIWLGAKYRSSRRRAAQPRHWRRNRPPHQFQLSLRAGHPVPVGLVASLNRPGGHNRRHQFQRRARGKAIRTVAPIRAFRNHRYSLLSVQK